MEQYFIDSIEITIIMGRFDDSGLDLVVKSQDIPLGITSSDEENLVHSNITIKEASNAENVIHWPKLSLLDSDRRSSIYNATMDALTHAEKIQAAQIGLFTMGLEVSRIPSWEIAEEIVKAINAHSKKDSQLCKIILVASSPTQVSSFQYVINNITIISEK